jgi:predicted nucleic acid-binding protein
VRIYLLDTSAVIAHVYHERGYRQVQALFEEEDATVLLAAPSLLELDTALKTKVADEAQRRAVLELYGGRGAEVVAVDRETALAAIGIRQACPRRLPGFDALIAGCAAAHGATLVHRDPHFDAIPANVLAVMRLTDAGETPAHGTRATDVKEPPASYGNGASSGRRVRKSAGARGRREPRP